MKSGFIKLLKVVAFAAALIPAARLLWAFLHDFGKLSVQPEATLGTNPVETITRSTGEWTLIFLVVTLAISPARALLRQPWLIRFRRMLGLFAFFYALLHFTTYIWFDQFFDVSSIVKDVAKRPFITVGFTAFVLLIPLALTSTRGWIVRLGGKRWQAVHRLIYVSAVAGVVHFLWLVKADLRRPLIYATILALLFGFRAVVWARGAAERNAAAAS